MRVLLMLGLTFLILFPPSLATSPKSMSASDVLRSHGLPIGLLPSSSIKEFSVEESSGRFHALLESPCTARFESDLHYDRNISGTVSYARLASLSGISAQELFLWFPVREIRVDVPPSGLIYFDVGVIYKQFSLSLFETPPECTPSSSSDDDDHLLAEGAHIAKIISSSSSSSSQGRMRYELDQADHRGGRDDKAVL